MLGHSERERRLPHRRSRRDDHEVGRPETTGDAIEVLESRREAGDLRAPLKRLGEVLNGFQREVTRVDEPTPDLALHEAVDEVFGAYEEVVGVRLALGHHRFDVLADSQQATKRR